MCRWGRRAATSHIRSLILRLKRKLRKFLGDMYIILHAVEVEDDVKLRFVSSDGRDPNIVLGDRTPQTRLIIVGSVAFLVNRPYR